MNTYGLIVGIDKYDQREWSMSGPCRNALAIAQWMTTITAPAKIWLFLDTIDDFKPGVAALRAQGVNVIESAQWSGIDSFCFRELANERPASSRLLMFWSGHGYVSNSGNWIFICRDYTDKEFPNRVFNASLFLRHLRSPAFHSFSETLLLADVCGIHPEVEIQDPRAGPAKAGDRLQRAFFATPEGEYAHGKDGEGVFTSSTLAVLQEVKEWPDLEKFSALLEAKLRKGGQPPFRMSAFARESETLNQVFGEVSGSELFENVFAMLNTVAVPPSRYRFHYRRTANRLLNPALHRAQGLTGMIRELTSLQDSHTGQVPYGLLDFLVRLTQIKELEKKVNQWLKANAPNQASALEGLRADLKSENLARILLVVVEHDASGEVTAYEPYLRTQNLAPVAHETLARSTVESWKDFECKLRRLLAELGTESISQIHFLADPPLFDRPFHEIAAPSGSFLGEEFVVLLRHRERLFSNKPHVRQPWIQYADALRPSAPEQVRVIPLPFSAEVLVGADRGMCYFTYLIPAATQGGARNVDEKMKLLSRLLRLGVPYLCWLHRPEAVDWMKMGEFLGACMAKSGTLDGFPDCFTQERVGLNEFAAGATLLWDDPGQNPFQ